jgi:hypothetical protein
MQLVLEYWKGQRALELGLEEMGLEELGQLEEVCLELRNLKCRVQMRWRWTG